MNIENHFNTWRAFKNGDWEAYTSLYNDYFKLLNNYGYKFTKDINLIEDAIHDLFVRLWTTRNNLGDPASVKNYLYKSLRNTILRKMQAGEKFSVIDADAYPSGFEVSYSNEPVSSIEERELQATIKNIINTLPPRQQEIIYLRFYEDLSYEEIADIMSININSTYKLLYKALQNLQQIPGTSLLLSLSIPFKPFFNFF
jgi:RNA polymerase sigma factor (sigma-70 family)